jgi:hypothetical protein
MTRINFFLIRGICAIRCFEMFMELAMEYFDGVFRHPVFSEHPDLSELCHVLKKVDTYLADYCLILFFRDLNL